MNLVPQSPGIKYVLLLNKINYLVDSSYSSLVTIVYHPRHTGQWRHLENTLYAVETFPPQKAIPGVITGSLRRPL